MLRLGVSAIAPGVEDGYADFPVETTMKQTEQTSASNSRHDYDVALRRAVSWLGDRYLLAEPVSRRAKESKSYFVETRRWLDMRTVDSRR
jgi:hypothetical protein